MDTKLSLGLSAVLAITTLAATQAFKEDLQGSKGMTILGGGICSVLFMFLLTAVGNLEGILFGKGFEIQIMPEVLLCLSVSMAVAASIHRVSITCCVLFSLTILYFMSCISQQVYAKPDLAPSKPDKKKRK